MAKRLVRYGKVVCEIWQNGLRIGAKQPVRFSEKAIVFCCIR